jgi:hypothetical protein
MPGLRENWVASVVSVKKTFHSELVLCSFVHLFHHLVKRPY